MAASLLELHPNRTGILSGPTSVKMVDPLFVQISLTFVNQIPSEFLVLSLIEPNAGLFSQTETEYPVEQRESFLDCRHYACLYDSATFPVNV